ncbi:MAG: 4-oxalocrotonate decarboxylase [Xanthobacteraceae bacterium]|nr:4-oxalocrotonate decarboxylase [Xanthobacteraceae bacterium]
MSILQDPRVKAGLDRQFAAWRRLTGAGGKTLGWKVGFGAPAAMTKLAITAPLTGYLMAENALPSGAVCSLAGWIKPVAEPEIAVHFGADVPGGASDADIRAAIAALGPAIELADLTFAPEEPERILAGNIYQRHVILGAPDAARAGGKLDGLLARVLVDGRETASTADMEANTGRIIGIVRQVADTLAAMNETIRAGQIIIAGSVVPPIFVQPDNGEVRFALDPVGEISVRFTR